MAIAVHAGLLVVGLSPQPVVPPDRPAAEDPEEAPVIDPIAVLPDVVSLVRDPKAAPMAEVRVPRRARRAAERPVAITASVPLAQVGSIRPMVEDALYRDDGRVRLPDEPIYAATKAPPDHYRMPGDGSEDDVFYRPPALVPQEDRIALRWEPRVSVGAEWYDRLVRATSVKTAIPLGPKFSLVCGASLAGMGGACMIRRDGGTGVVVHRSADPPPWEKARSVQCRGLRDDLAAADEPERIAWLLDRLLALCSTEPVPATPSTTTPGTGPGVEDPPETAEGQSAEPDR